MTVVLFGAYTRVRWQTLDAAAPVQLMRHGATCIDAEGFLKDAESAWGLLPEQEVCLWGQVSSGEQNWVNEKARLQVSGPTTSIAHPTEGRWLVAVEHGSHPWAGLNIADLPAVGEISYNWIEVILPGAGALQLARPEYKERTFDLVWPASFGGPQQARLDDKTGWLLTNPFLPAKGSEEFYQRPAFRYGVLQDGSMQWLDLLSKVAPEPIRPATKLLRTRLALLGRELEARGIHFADDSGQHEPRFVFEDADVPGDFHETDASVVRTVSHWDDHEDKRRRAFETYDPEDLGIFHGWEERVGYRALSSEIDVTEVELFGFPWEVCHQKVSPVWLADVIERSATAAGLIAFAQERIVGQVDGTVQLQGHDIAKLEANQETELLSLRNATDPADRIQRFVYLLANGRAGLERRLSAARDPIVATVLAARGFAVGPAHNRQPGPFPERCAAVMGLAQSIEGGEDPEPLRQQAVAAISEADERRLALFWAKQLGADLAGDAIDWATAHDVEGSLAWVAAKVAPSVGSLQPGETPPPDPARPALCDMGTDEESATIPMIKMLPNADTVAFLAAWHAADIINRQRARAALLRHAIANERFDIARALLSDGALIGVPETTPLGHSDRFSSRVRETALFAAIEAGSLAAVRFCLDHGADIRVALLETGTTAQGDVREAPTSAVVIAARLGQPELLRLFLDLGGDPKSPMANGITPITAAAYGGSVPCLQALVKAGADPCQDPASHVFVDGPLTLTPILYACDRNNDDAILFLLAHGADPNVQRGDGEWALQLAIEKCRRETIEALIAFGADPFAVNWDGIDVLHLAALRRRADIVPIILKAGVDPSQNVEIETGMSSLMTAAAQGESAIVEMLLQAGADPFNCSTEGYTPVDLARKAADPDSSDTPFDKTISLLVAAARRANEDVPS